MVRQRRDRARPAPDSPTRRRTMYAIVTIAGKQWHVAPKQLLEVPLREAELGDTLTFVEVHLVADAGKVQLGKPFLSGGKVVAKVLAHGRGPKLIVGKFKRRKAYHRTKGHRQDFTR